MIYVFGENVEDKVLWKEPTGELRSLMGTIVSETKHDITIKRRDGTFTISRELILKIIRRTVSSQFAHKAYISAGGA